MSALRRLRQVPGRVHRRVRGETCDQGSSLVEVIVGMAIMSICGAIFLGSAVTLSRVTAKTQSVTNAASQTNLAYLNLDRTVRYASAITKPARTSAGTWYVEFRDTTSGSEVCTQLRLDNATKQLAQRSWSTDSSPVTPTAFRQIATGFTNGTAAYNAGEVGDQPFFLEPDSTTANHQRLTITMISASGATGTSSTSRSSFTLTALNSVVPAPTGSICQQAGRP